MFSEQNSLQCIVKEVEGHMDATTIKLFIIGISLVFVLLIVGSVGSYLQKTKCAFCAELVQKKAIKCPHCGENRTTTQ